jgi:1,5-anhydro-D-fructose reductase (1,5-anhydro-D-mannitol-forming)
MMKLALLSYWHVHAKDYANDAAKHPDTEIISLWDENPERGRKMASEKGWTFFENLNEILASDVDGVIVTTPTTMHQEVMVKAANAGKHIFTEKVLAHTTTSAKAILEAVQKNKVSLMVSLPRMRFGLTKAIQEHIGKLGTLSMARVRIAHNGALPSEQHPQGWLPTHFIEGEEAAGGAMIDLGCHPMYLVRTFLGMPSSVSSSYGHVTKRGLEDNAISMLHYPNGAIGLVETGFVTPGFTALEFHGEKGQLVFTSIDKELKHFDGNAWTTLSIPQDEASLFESWVEHIQKETRDSENNQLALDLTMLMEATNQAAKENKMIRLEQ